MDITWKTVKIMLARIVSVTGENYWIKRDTPIANSDNEPQTCMLYRDEKSVMWFKTYAEISMFLNGMFYALQKKFSKE